MFRPKNIMLLILFIFYQTFLAEFFLIRRDAPRNPSFPADCFLIRGTPYTSINTSQSQYANQTFLLEFFIFGGRPPEAPPFSSNFFIFGGRPPEAPPFYSNFLFSGGDPPKPPPFYSNFLFSGGDPRNPLFIAMAEKHCSVNNQSL